MADNSLIARPYAQATFELAQESGELAAWSRLLHAAAAVVADADVERLIEAPDTRADELIGLINDVAAKQVAGEGGGPDSQHAGNLIKLLAENGRLLALPEIAVQFDRLKSEVENRIDVVLTAASPVDEAQQAKIAASLKNRLGRDVNLQFQLDESLIGGARLQADDLVIDGSVRAGLDKLASTLTN